MVRLRRRSSSFRTSSTKAKNEPAASRDVEPGGEAVLVLFDLSRQRIVAEEIAHLGDGGVDGADILVLADEDDVALRQQEDLAVELLDQRLERVGRDAHMVRAAILGAQARQMHDDGAAARRVALQTLDIVEQELLDARRSFLRCCFHLPIAPDRGETQYRRSFTEGLRRDNESRRPIRSMGLNPFFTSRP